MIGFLRVRGVAAAVAEEYLVLADIGKVHELLAILAADRAGVRLDSYRGQTAALKYVRVRLEHRVVAAVQAFPVGVEGVEIHHDELAQADQAAPGAQLIPELGLDLIDEGRQVAVALHLLLEEIGHRLLVRRSEHHLALAPVFHREQRRDVRLAPA